MKKSLTLRVLLAGCFYYLGAWLGVNFTINPDGIAIIWPPNAILLAAFLYLPRKVWPQLSLVILVAECAADYPAFPIPMAITFGVVNLFEAALAVFLIQRFIGPRFGFETLKSTVLFFLLVPVLASATAALGGAGVYWWFDSSAAPYFVAWRLWWFGDAVGLAVLTPLFIAFQQRANAVGVRDLFTIDLRRSRELGLLWAGLLLVGCLSLIGKQLDTLSFYITPILLLPFVIWGAVRFTTLMASINLFVVAGFTVSYLLFGQDVNPFLAPELSVWQTQEYLITVCLVSMGLASLMREFDAQRSLLRLQGSAMMSCNDTITIADAQAPDMPLIWVNTRFKELFGYDDKEILGHNCRFLQGEFDNRQARQTIRQCIAQGRPCRVLLQNQRKSGERLWVELSLSPVRDRENRVTHYIGIQRDLTEEKQYQEKLAAAEEQLRQYNLELEQKVEERTRSLEAANCELLELNERLATLASTDALTGIANRRQFFEVGARELNRCGRQQGTALLLALDLDHFKRINDHYGHDAGDSVLCKVIEPVKSVIRPDDLFGRVGGEEFLILMTDLTEPLYADIAERIRKLVDRLDVRYDDHLIKLTVSIGVAVWDGRSDLKTLVKQADEALYAAKDSGRNRVCEFSKDA